MTEPLNKKDPGRDTETVDFEQQLHDYQHRIANILESFTDGFFELDHDWKVTYWNKEAERMLHMPREKMIGSNLWEIYGEAVPLKFFSEYHKAVETNTAVRFEEFFAPHQMWLEVAAFPSGDGLSVYFKDITASKESIAILKSERQKYSDLFNLSPVPQWVYDFDTLAFLDVNEAAIIHYGYSRAEFLGMTIREVRPKEDLPSFDQMYCTEVVPGFFNKSFVRHQKKNGQLMSVCVEGNSVSFEGKNARLVMVIDRTGEIEAGKALEDSIKRFQIVSKATSDAIWDWNMQTGEVLWNQGIKGIFGYKEICSTEKWWQENVHPEDLPKVLQKISLLISSKKTKLKMEYRFRGADGSYRFILDRSFMIFNEERKAVRMIGSMQDITERVSHLKAIEAQNRRLKEISWIQSHKVRSPLAKILGLVSLIAANDKDLPAIRELIPLLQLSAEQLDQVLKEIVDKTE